MASFEELVGVDLDEAPEAKAGARLIVCTTGLIQNPVRWSILAMLTDDVSTPVRKSAD